MFGLKRGTVQLHEHEIPDMLIAAPEKIHFTKEEIEKRIYFQEQFYTYHIELIPS